MRTFYYLISRGRLVLRLFNSVAQQCHQTYVFFPSFCSVTLSVLSKIMSTLLVARWLQQLQLYHMQRKPCPLKRKRGHFLLFFLLLQRKTIPSQFPLGSIGQISSSHMLTSLQERIRMWVSGISSFYSETYFCQNRERGREVGVGKATNSGCHICPFSNTHLKTPPPFLYVAAG